MLPLHKSKLLPNNASSEALTKVSAHFNNTNRFEEARLYAQAATTSGSNNNIVSALASCQLLFSLAGLQTNANGGPDPTILRLYRTALQAAEWHWGADNLISMCLHDRMSAIFHKAKDPKKALEYHKHSLSITAKELGKNHSTTAGYLCRVHRF